MRARLDGGLDMDMPAALWEGRRPCGRAGGRVGGPAAVWEGRAIWMVYAEMRWWKGGRDGGRAMGGYTWMGDAGVLVTAGL